MVFIYSCATPALALTSLNKLIVAGDYGKTVYAFDPRANKEPQFTYVAHSRAILNLGLGNYFVDMTKKFFFIYIWLK